MEIIPLIDLDTDSVSGYYSKGHFDKTEFCKQIQKQWGDSVCQDDVKCVMARTIPIKGSSCDYVFKESMPGRGAFKATVVYV